MCETRLKIETLRVASILVWSGIMPFYVLDAKKQICFSVGKFFSLSKFSFVPISGPFQPKTFKRTIFQEKLFTPILSFYATVTSCKKSKEFHASTLKLQKPHFRPIFCFPSERQFHKFVIFYLNLKTFCRCNFMQKISKTLLIEFS